MSEVAGATTPVEPSLRRRRRWPWLVGVPVIVVVAAIAVTALVVLPSNGGGSDDVGYGPLEAGGSVGLAGPGITYDESDGTRTARLGSGPAFALSELSNAGTRAVRVTGIDRNGEIRDARWAPLPFGAETVFDPPRWRPFPATVPADSSIQVRLTIGRSDSCANIDPATGANFVYTGDYLVRWRSRDAAHETFIDGNDFGEPLLLC